MATLIKSTGETSEVKPENKNGKFSLAELQKFVGGYIEMFSHKGETFVMNEEGLLKGMPDNLNATKELQRRVGGTIQVLVGDVLICNSKELE